jgi:mutator protein MutT
MWLTMLPKKEGAGVIIFKENEVLLVKSLTNSDQLDDTYGFPAGTTEDGESFKATALRELYEETGLTATEADLIDFPNNYFEAEIEFKSGRKLGTITLFLCKNYSGEPQITEEVMPEWHKINQVEKLNLLPNVLTAINNALVFLKQ